VKIFIICRTSNCEVDQARSSGKSKGRLSRHLGYCSDSSDGWQTIVFNFNLTVKGLTLTVKTICKNGFFGKSYDPSRSYGHRQSNSTRYLYVRSVNKLTGLHGQGNTCFHTAHPMTHPFKSNVYSFLRKSSFRWKNVAWSWSI